MWRTRIAWFLFGFAACLLILIIIPLKFEPEFKAIEALNLITTIIIAILISHYGAKQYSDFRQAKNYLIEHVNNITKILEEAHCLFFDCYTEQVISDEYRRTILALKRDFNNSISLLEDALKDCKIRVDKFEVLMQLRRDYIDALTNDPFPSKPYDAVSFSLENRTHRELSVALQSLRFEINSK